MLNSMNKGTSVSRLGLLRSTAGDKQATAAEHAPPCIVLYCTILSHHSALTLPLMLLDESLMAV
jgi:hypothetical protein